MLIKNLIITQSLTTVKRTHNVGRNNHTWIPGYYANESDLIKVGTGCHPAGESDSQIFNYLEHKRQEIFVSASLYLYV